MNIDKKLELASEYVMKFLEHGNMTPEEVIETSWYIADAMEAEAEKRIKAKAEKDAEESKVFFEKLTKNEDGSCKHFHTTLNRGECFDCGEKLNSTDSPQSEWQPDWSVSPDDVVAWVQYENLECWWLTYNVGYKINIRHSTAPSFNYRGNWRQSLRKRP